MDILNFISWIKGKRLVTTVDPAKTLIPVGLKDGRRDDDYLAGAISVEDLAAQIAPQPAYKVYTALLTQSGGDNEQIISSGPVTQGVTYWVIDNDTPGSNWDFSNVGGPVYPYGGYFVAINSEIPISYFGPTVKYNTGAPVVTVLENTIGNIWFTYEDVGQYLALSDGAFPLDKTGCFIGGTGTQSNCPSFVANTIQFGPNVGSGVYIQCSGVEFTPDYYTNDALVNTMIEIRVYN